MFQIHLIFCKYEHEQIDGLFFFFLQIFLLFTSHPFNFKKITLLLPPVIESIWPLWPFYQSCRVAVWYFSCRPF